MHRRALLGGALAAPAILSIPVRAQGTITLNGAVQFNDEHAFTRCLAKFEELVKLHYGKPINFVLHKNSSLGLEKQYFEYMAQGRAVDYGIVSPAHMSTFSRAAPFIDAPFLFRDLGHWDNVLQLDLLKPVADEVEKRARVMLIGYARRRRPEHLRQQAAADPGRAARPQGPRAGRADLEPHLPGRRHGADRHRLQRDLQRHPEQRHRRRRERGGRRRADALLRGGAAARHDPARHHHPAALLLVRDLRQAAERPSGGDPPRRARGRDLRPPDRIRGGRDQARGAGEGRPPEARRVHRARRR